MYTAFFGLREKPFALSPDPRFLFLAESHREALAHLLYGIEQGEGFIAITGEVGTGKTTLCRTLLQRLGSDVEVAFLFNPKLSALELLQAIHSELGIEPSPGSSGPVASWRELSDTLDRFLLDRKREGRRVLLIVDEAQNLEPDTLEQIRLLSNLETETSKLIQIVLLGQPELDAKLETQGLRQLRQRISVRWRLAPLTAKESGAYVRHRLRIAAGVERPLFSEAALRAVHRASGGVPRVINIVCDRALLAAYAEGAVEVGASLVARAAREMDGMPARGRRARRGLAWAGAAALVAAIALAAGAYGVPRLRARYASPAAAAVDGSGPGTPVALPAAATGKPTPESVETSGIAPAEGLPATVAAEGPIPPVAPTPDALPAATPAPAPDLPALLHAVAPDASMAAALDAALTAWGEAPRALGGAELPDAIAALEDAGFAVLPLADASLDLLHALDYPTLLRFPAADGRGPVALLVGLDGGVATLEGVTPGGSIVVPRADLEAQWKGEAFVVWRDFEPLPETLRPGDVGPGVDWLQGALAELGFLSRERTGHFDLQTMAAVLAFQQSRALEADGAVGPRTKMALYAALRRYGVPRIVASREAGPLS